MITFKPDTTLLVIGLSSLFLLEKASKPNYKMLAMVGFLLLISVFFKQNFFIIYFLVFTLIILNKNLSKNEKFVFYLFILLLD